MIITTIRVIINILYNLPKAYTTSPYHLIFEFILVFKKLFFNYKYTFEVMLLRHLDPLKILLFVGRLGGSVG